MKFDSEKFDSEFQRKKELLKKRINEKFKNRELTKEESEGLKRAGNEELIQYSRSLLRDSKEHNECD
jgi:hypothetical protein